MTADADEMIYIEGRASRHRQHRDLASIGDSRDAFVRAALLLATELGRDRVLAMIAELEQKPLESSFDAAARRHETVVVLRWCA